MGWLQARHLVISVGVQTAPWPPEPVHSPLMQPATIGPFEIERELGRGGMGVVYLGSGSAFNAGLTSWRLRSDSVTM